VKKLEEIPEDELDDVLCRFYPECKTEMNRSQIAWLLFKVL